MPPPPQFGLAVTALTGLSSVFRPFFGRDPDRFRGGPNRAAAVFDATPPVFSHLRVVSLRDIGLRGIGFGCIVLGGYFRFWIYGSICRVQTRLFPIWRFQAWRFQSWCFSLGNFQSWHSSLRGLNLGGFSFGGFRLGDVRLRGIPGKRRLVHRIRLSGSPLCRRPTGRLLLRRIL